MTALFALLLVDAGARYVMCRRQVAGWWISLGVAPCWAVVAVLVHLAPAAVLALPWAIAAALNIRAARRAQVAAAAPAE